MTGIDINRGTTGASALLPRSVSNQIWANALEQSLVMRLGTQFPIAGNGLTIPQVTGEPTAAWVAETAEKPVSRGTFSSKNVTPYKLAVIEPFSNEFRRDLPGLYAELARRLPNAIARLFDSTVLFGSAPGSGFDTLASAPTAVFTDYASMVTALTSVAAVEDASATAWVTSPAASLGLLAQVDTTGRPLFTLSPNTGGSVGALLGRPLYESKHVFNAATTPDTVGFVGDWSYLGWGQVGAITIDATDVATINDGGTQLNLWQRNMFALRVEVELACAVRNVNAFARLTLAS